jgi:hypothetical protein
LIIIIKKELNSQPRLPSRVLIWMDFPRNKIISGLLFNSLNPNIYVLYYQI